LDGLPIFTWLHDYGYVLVDLFFVVSGFIFAHVYLAKGRIETDAASFAIARFARLYPLHLVTLLAAAGVLAVGNPATPEGCCNDGYHFLLNLFMLQESGLNEGMSFNTPAWSISVEILCYILFYCAAVLAPARFWQLAALLCIGGLFATLWIDPRVDHIGRGLCGFFAGTLVYRAKAAPLAFWLALAVIGWVVVTWVPRFAFGALLSMTIWPAVVGLSSRIAVLHAPVLGWIGDRSYSIYLVHSPVYMAINVLVFSGQPVPEAMSVSVMLAGWILVLAISDLSFRYLETPARQALKRRWVAERPVKTGP
jgi:peptidoglycan/LPS O-acetylase OafA/YrhL